MGLLVFLCVCVSTPPLLVPTLGSRCWERGGACQSALEVVLSNYVKKCYQVSHCETHTGAEPLSTPRPPTRREGPQGGGLPAP